MTLEPGGDPIEIQWYFTDKPPLPFEHIGASRNWLSDKDELTDPGEVKGADRPWVNGKGPTLPCCDKPFGTVEAWQGLPNQPKRKSCQWAPYVGNIRLGLKPAGKVLKPVYYKGSTLVTLTPRGKVVNPRVYGGNIRLGLTPAGKVITPIYYPGNIRLGLTPAGVSHYSPRYDGNIRLGLTPAGIVVTSISYNGAIGLALTPQGSAYPGITYDGAIGLALTPEGTYSPPNPQIPFGSCTLTYSDWTITVAGVTGTSPYDPNGTWNLTFNSSLTAFTTFSGSVPVYPYWIISYVAITDTWYVQWWQSGSGATVLWEISPSSGYNCLAANNYPFIAALQGSGWPNPLTVTPS